MRPAVRIILAPILHRYAIERREGEAYRRTAWIDPRATHPTKILFHELLHIRYPSWSETRVKYETARRWRKTNWKQRARLLQLLASARLEGEED